MGDLKTITNERKRGNKNICGLYSIVICCLFFLCSWSQTHLHWSMRSSGQIYLETERQQSVRQSEKMKVVFFLSGLLRLQAGLCSVVNTWAKVWFFLCHRGSRTEENTQFITLIPACRHSVLRTSNPKQKADFFFFAGGSLFEFNFLTGVRGTARFASEDALRRGAQMSRPLALHHLCSFQEVVQVLGVQHPRSPGRKLKLSHF